MRINTGIKKIVNLKCHFLHKHFSHKAFKLLDVGAGNHSASRLKKIFPNCFYYGVDIDKSYANAADDFKVMEKFFELDLTKLNYETIPDDYFDAIIMSHVIEHLFNGDKVLPLLFKKLKPNGVMYIEYPGRRSTKLPSMYGTLNFYDDSTHVRIYTVQELKKIVEDNNCEVLNSGTRRNYYYIIATPLRIVMNLLKGKRIEGNLFWDLLGFAEFLEIKKKA